VNRVRTVSSSSEIHLWDANTRPNRPHSIFPNSSEITILWAFMSLHVVLYKLSFLNVTQSHPLKSQCLTVLGNIESPVDPKSRFSTPNFHLKSRYDTQRRFFGTKFAFKKSKCNRQIKYSPLFH
jgi:hypothetical protein